MWQSLPCRVHSISARKRIFQSKKRYEEVIKPLLEQKRVVEPLKYPPSYTPPKVLSNGWSAPPEPAVAEELTRKLPFKV